MDQQQPAPGAPQGGNSGAENSMNEPEEGVKMAVNMLSALGPVLQDMGAPKEVQSAAELLLTFLSGGGGGNVAAPGGAENAAGNPNAKPMA